MFCEFLQEVYLSKSDTWNLRIKMMCKLYICWSLRCLSLLSAWEFPRIIFRSDWFSEDFNGEKVGGNNCTDFPVIFENLIHLKIWKTVYNLIAQI